MALAPRSFNYDCCPGGFCLLKVPADYCFRSWRLLGEGAVSKIVSDKDGYHITLDIQQFSPDEIKVKTSGNEIIVEAKHDEKQDEYGFISRQFTRRYVLPSGYELETASSTISTDGVLGISVGRSRAVAETTRTIPVVQTGIPHKSIEQVDQSCQGTQKDAEPCQADPSICCKREEKIVEIEKEIKSKKEDANPDAVSSAVDPNICCKRNNMKIEIGIDNNSKPLDLITDPITSAFDPTICCKKEEKKIDLTSESSTKVDTPIDPIPCSFDTNVSFNTEEPNVDKFEELVLAQEDILQPLTISEEKSKTE